MHVSHFYPHQSPNPIFTPNCWGKNGTHSNPHSCLTCKWQQLEILGGRIERYICSGDRMALPGSSAQGRYHFFNPSYKKWMLMNKLLITLTNKIQKNHKPLHSTVNSFPSNFRSTGLWPLKGIQFQKQNKEVPIYIARYSRNIV